MELVVLFLLVCAVQSASAWLPLRLGTAQRSRLGPLRSSNVPVLTDFDSIDQPGVPEQKGGGGSGVEAYLQECSTLIGKTSLADLKQYVHKLSLPALDAQIPNDFEELASVALDLCWKRSNGDWQSMIQGLREDLGPGAARADAAIKDAVEALDGLNEQAIKKLIRQFADEGVNAVPQLNREKYSGKLLRGDYVAELLDVVRVKCANDYVKVAEILAREKRKGKGFGK